MCLYRTSVILGEEQIVQKEPLRLWAKELKGKPMANPRSSCIPILSKKGSGWVGEEMS